MKLSLCVIGALIAAMQVATGCYLSLDNSTGWVFPIFSGIITLVISIHFAYAK